MTSIKKPSGMRDPPPNKTGGGSLIFLQLLFKGSLIGLFQHGKPIGFKFYQYSFVIVPVYL